MNDEPTDADRAKAKELALLCRSGVGGTELRELAIAAALAEAREEGREASARVIAQALADAREEGRDSVGLGDFMPDPCDEETPVPSTWHDAYGYGYLDCTLRKGHDGGHEHETSGLTWSTR